MNIVPTLRILGRLGWIFLTITACVGCWRSGDTRMALVGGSSMEPTLSGPRLKGYCPSCQGNLSFSSELVERTPLLRCHRCDNYVDKETLTAIQPGQPIAVASLKSSDPIGRGDLVVFRELDTVLDESQSIKRLVGFPKERIEIDDGDLLINGIRFQKTAIEAFHSLVHVEYWDEALKQLSKPLSDPIVCSYESMSLWPRTGERAVRHPSPILDELSSNPDDPYAYTPVKDIGIVLDVDLQASDHFQLCIRIWSNGAPRTIVWSFADGICQIYGGNNSPDRLKASVKLSTINLSDGKPIPTTSEQLSKPYQWVVASIDNRMIALLIDREDFSIRGWEWPLYECLDIGRMGLKESIEIDSKLRPISIRLSKHADSNLNGFRKTAQTPHFRNIELVRDIHYRGPQGELRYELPRVEGYHVLGDNVSISSDSRTSISAGISRHQMTGRVQLRSSCRTRVAPQEMQQEKQIVNP